MIGNRKTTTHQSSLCEGARFDFKTSIKTMMSRMRTMNPTIPPPLPYFKALPWPLAASVSSAMAKEARERKNSCKSMMRRFWNILFTSLQACWNGRGSEVTCKELKWSETDEVMCCWGVARVYPLTAAWIGWRHVLNPGPHDFRHRIPTISLATPSLARLSFHEAIIITLKAFITMGVYLASTFALQFSKPITYTPYTKWSWCLIIVLAVTAAATNNSHTSSAIIA